MCIFTSFVQLYRRKNIYVPRDEILITFLRSVSGSVALFGLYISMKYITMGDATAISFLSPVWTYILSYFILKEKINWIQIVSLPASIFGVLLIANPYLFIDDPDDAKIMDVSMTIEELLNDGLLYPDTGSINITSDATNNILMTTNKLNLSSNASITIQDNPTTNQSLIYQSQDTYYDPSQKIYGTIMAVVSSLSLSATLIVLKFRKKTSQTTTIFWFSLTTSAMAFVIMSSYSGCTMPSSLDVWLLILSNGTFSFIGQFFFQMAFLYEDTSIISLVRTVEVVIAFLITMVFFDDYIEWTR